VLQVLCVLALYVDVGSPLYVQVAHTEYKLRQISAQEAYFLAAQLHLTYQSRSFVQVKDPLSTTRTIKPAAEINALDAGSTDIYRSNLIIRFENVSCACLLPYFRTIIEPFAACILHSRTYSIYRSCVHLLNLLLSRLFTDPNTRSSPR
jgi:hypothetical protein